MPKSNAQRQADYRARRNSWPTTDAHMRALLLEIYLVGRAHAREGEPARGINDVIEIAVLQYERHMDVMADDGRDPGFLQDAAAVRGAGEALKRK